MGCVVAIDGQPRREVVVKGIEALKAVWHRGAVDADGKTGDGAGIHVQIPQDFFQRKIKGAVRTDQRIAVGMVFLPRTSFQQQEACRTIVESEVLGFGYAIRGWRQVPVDTSVLGEKAAATRPEIEQIIIGNPKGFDEEQFERDLYLIRRRIEKQALAENITDFYICSLSCRSVIYKGLFLAESLAAFYPDLQDERFVSSFALFHQRYSTNTMPSWKLAQPFRTLAHNGEINTLRGNVNWMKSHETRMVAPAFGEHNEDVKPIIQPGSSDSAALDAVCEALVRAGRQLPLVKTMLIPPAWSNRMAIQPGASRPVQLLQLRHGAVGRPSRHRRHRLALGRGRPRPQRPAPHALFAHPRRPSRRRLRDRHGAPGRQRRDREGQGRSRREHRGRPGRAAASTATSSSRTIWPALKPYSRWMENITHLDERTKARPFSPAAYERAELRRRQALYGLTIEDMELILAPMVLDAKEAVGSMGDDTPLAVLSRHYRGLHHFFRQQFSQVTNPPIDPLREWRVMSLKTRFGNLGNVYDEDPSQTRILQLESPVLTTSEVEAAKAHFGANQRTHRLHLRRRPRGPPARRPGAHPPGGRGSRARRLRGADPERRGGRPRPGADPDDPGHRVPSTATWSARACAASAT